MLTRTTTRTVTFTRPFKLAGFDEVLPAGSYEIETDEIMLQDVSFPVWRRQSAYMRMPAGPGQPGAVQTLTVNPNELDEALYRDRMGA